MALGLACLTACVGGFSRDIASDLADAEALAGARWGMVVEDASGKVLVDIRGDERFIPASNTKMFVAAAAWHRLGGLDAPDPSMATSIRIEPHEDGAPDIVLVGGGDPTLRDTPDCAWNCLAMLADIVVQNRIERVGSVIGDDRLFPDERWPLGMSWNNIPTRSGAATSALSVNDNETIIEVRPGAESGAPAQASWRQGDGFIALDNEAVTMASGEEDLRIERLPNSATTRLYGVTPLSAGATTLRVGVDDPALFAAWRLTQLLKARGVIVEGAPAVRRRSASLADDPDLRGETPPAVIDQAPDRPAIEIGRLLPAPMAESLRHMLKVSQNMHADVMLRRLGLIEGGGSAADGHAVIHAMLAEAGVARTTYDFADGSGMSTYNRVTPLMVTRFLRWTQTQPWGGAFREALPVGGVDGTLSRRFAGTSLEGRIFAKSGTLSAVNALSGFMVARSGQVLVFSAYANDWPSSATSATSVMDAALVRISEVN